VRIAIAVGLALAGLVSAGAVLASTTGWKVQPSPSPASGGAFPTLFGVAATSRTNAWAVGYGALAQDSFYCGPSIIERWNGKVWKVQAGAKLTRPQGKIDSLQAVAATSATNAWAVGGYQNAQCSESKPLIEHWNGKVWKEQESPRGDLLNAVAATSSTNAWAVGGLYRALIEHWNGKAWKVEPSPNLGGGELYGVAATSSTNAWAVGSSSNGALIEHWGGHAWKVEPSPKHSGSLHGVAATSRTNAWAVGGKLIEHWNGKRWKVEPSPKHSGSLQAVAATSPNNAWAVGTRGLAVRRFGPNSSPSPGSVTSIIHWNGKTWKLQNSPDPGGVGDSQYNDLSGVAAVSSSDDWAVGSFNNSLLILHWNGRR
jgi:hypothetical protein